MNMDCLKDMFDSIQGSKLGKIIVSAVFLGLMIYIKKEQVKFLNRASGGFRGSL